VRFIGNQTGPFMLALRARRRHNDRFNPRL
jgi:hypothetical protein